MKKFLKIVSLVIVVISACILPMACSSGQSNTPEGKISTKNYTITFDSRGGENVEPKITNDYGYLEGDEPVSECEGFEFYGWFIEGTNKKFDFSVPVSSDVTLYAKWAKYLDYECSYALNDDNTYTITAYSGDHEAIILPHEYQGTAVTAIGPEAFNKCSASFITIPYSIKEIGNSAFANAKLTMLEIPHGMKKIGNYAFECCYELKTVYLAGEKIGRAAFTNCVTLTNVFIDKNAGRLGMDKEIFNTCMNLKNIYCANASAGSEWDEEWKGKNENANVIWNCEWNGNMIFHNNNYSVVVGYMDFNWINPSRSLNLEHVDRSATVEHEGFDGYYSEPIAAIGNSAFRNTYGIQYLALGEKISYVGEYAFAGCKTLTRVYINPKVAVIGAHAFDGCDSLQEIVCYTVGQPSNWSSDWKKGCNANVVWAQYDY